MKEYQNHHRWYSPDLGRYLSSEPLLLGSAYPTSQARRGAGTPSYAYAANDPTRFIDRTGLSPEERLRILAEYAVFLTRETEAGRRLDAPGPVTDFMATWTYFERPLTAPLAGPRITTERVHPCGEQSDDLVSGRH